MAKRRRRGKYKTRPVKPQQPEAAPDDPALQSQQVDDAAAAPTAPVAPLTGIPSTGMPIAAALGQQLPADNSVPEDQGYARGGLIPAPMPGFSDYTEMKTDPVARRKYSPKHVGFAKGGEVDDPMDYVPDQPQGRPQQQPSRFDEFNMIGRQPQTFNPALAAGETAYATGGPIAAAQVPAYTAPVYPAPSEANARLYSAMDALRERTANPPRLQMPAAPASASAPAAASAQPPPLFGRAPGQAGPYNRWTFAEGGEVPPPQSAPDAQGYLNGDNAMDPQQLDGVLQQIAQLDPSKGEDAVNLTAIVQAAQSGDMNRASSILAGFRRRFDSLNAHAQGAAAHGDINTAAKLAGKAHSQVPDGMTVNYAVAPDGSVIATVSPSGQTFQMSAAQFHDYLVGPGTSFDHILENGLEKNLAIASGGQSGQQAQVANPAPTGYAEGGEVEEDDKKERRDYYRPTEDPNDPWSQRAGVLAKAETAPVDRRITTKSILPLQGTSATSTRSPLDMYVTGPERSFYDAQGNRAPVYETGWRLGASPYDVGPFSTRETPMPETPARERTYPMMTRGGQLIDVPTGETEPTGYLGGAYKPETKPRGYIGGPDKPGPMESQQDNTSRQIIKDVLDHSRRSHGLIDNDPENAAPYQVAGDWMPPPAGGRTALEAGIGAPEQPAGGRTALSRGIGYEGPAGGQTAYQAAQARESEPQTDERIPTGRGGFVARPATEPAAPAEPRMGARPVPGPASARRGVEYPEPLPGEGLGGSTVSARRVGTPPAAAVPELQQLGSREDISLPPAAQPTAAVAAPPGSNQAAYDAAAARGDIYTTPRWSMDRLTKEGIPDIMQGKLFGRKNVVDYPERPAVAETRPAAPALGPVDVEQRRADYIRDRSGQQPQTATRPAAVEPHEQRMREIDKQQELLRQPIVPAGRDVSEPKTYEGKRGVERYNKEVVADQHRYTNEVNQRNAMITDQRHQDDTIIRAYNNAKKDGTDTPELKRAYEASMYRMTGGKLAIPREEAPATKKEEPGIMQRIFGTGASAQVPAAQGTYGSPGWPPRAPSPGKRWGQDANGRFVEY